MQSLLLQRVGFQWVKHPHRVHTMTVDSTAPNGLELRGGPWTTGERSKDHIVENTSWKPVDGLEGREISLDSQVATGPGTAEARWSLDNEPGTLDAVVGFTVRSLSHPAGFNLAGFGVGVRADDDGAAEAWMRVEAGKTPERPERFEHIEFEASLSVVRFVSAGFSVESLQRRVMTPGGFRPKHDPHRLAAHRVPRAITGFSWTVHNTPQRRGRYLRGIDFGIDGSSAVAGVSNSGEVTRKTDMTYTVDVLTGDVAPGTDS